MSLAAACAETQALIRRARSLFATESQSPDAASESAGELRRAAQTTGDAGAAMRRLSGELVDAHGLFVGRSAPALTASSHTDMVLEAQLRQAAALSQTGAAQIDAIAEENKSTAAAAAAARTPAAQMAVVAALRSQAARTQQIVDSTQQAAGQIAQTTRGLRYPDGGSGGPDDTTAGDPDQRHTVQMVDNKTKPPPPPPPQAGRPVDPADPIVGDPRFGYWENVPTPPPYVGAQPPPLKDQFRPFPDGTPLKVGPTTGMFTPGKTWIGDIDPPAVQGQEEYRFRMSGTDATTITRMVNENGVWQQQRWVQNVYEYQRNTSMVFDGDLGGLPPIQNIDRDWKPITLPQIAALSANNADTTFYLPDGCGGTVKFNDGVSIDPTNPNPIPIMTRPR